MSGANVSVSAIERSSDFCGYNSKYMSDDGVYDHEAALADFVKSHTEKRAIKTQDLIQAKDLSYADSHEAFLYNMLISWFRARIYRANGDTDNILRLKRSGYVSTHAKVAVNGVVEDTTVECPLGPPVADVDQTVMMTVRDDEHYFDVPYVILYDASNPRAEAFYLEHTNGRTKTSQLNCDIALPKFIGRRLMLDRLNPVSNGVAYNFNDWDDCESMWQWICSYVSLNRLHKQFAATLETFMAVCAQPKWHTAEATWWSKARMIVKLGIFKPTRARLKTNMEGVAFEETTDHFRLLRMSTEAPMRQVITSALLNNYLWYGLYLVANERIYFSGSKRGNMALIDDSNVFMHSVNMRSCLIEICTNRSAPSFMSQGAHLQVDLSRLDQDQTVDVMVDHDGTTLTDLSDHLPCPVSCANVLGSFTDKFDMTQHLSGHQTMYRRVMGHEARDVNVNTLKIATLYRLFLDNDDRRDLHREN
jgi:hypothetical protein